MFGIIKKRLSRDIREKKHDCWPFAPMGSMPDVTLPQL